MVFGWKLAVLPVPVKSYLKLHPRTLGSPPVGAPQPCAYLV